MSRPIKRSQPLEIGKNALERLTHRQLTIHDKFHGVLNGFAMRILSVHECKYSPARLDDLGVLVFNPFTALTRLPKQGSSSSGKLHGFERFNVPGNSRPIRRQRAASR